MDVEDLSIAHAIDHDSERQLVLDFRRHIFHHLRVATERLPERRHLPALVVLSLLQAISDINEDSTRAHASIWMILEVPPRSFMRILEATSRALALQV